MTCVLHEPLLHLYDGPHLLRPWVSCASIILPSCAWNVTCSQMIAARATLRTHTAVVAELQRWWDCAMRSVDVDGNGLRVNVLPRLEYIRINRLLTKVMLETWDEESAQASAEEDWTADSGGKDAMEREPQPPSAPAWRGNPSVAAQAQPKPKPHCKNKTCHLRPGACQYL